MAPGHGRGQGFSQQGQLSAHTAGVETTGKQVRGRPLEQLAKDWRCQKQAPAAGPRRTCRLAGAGPVSHAGTAPAARASRKRRAASGGGGVYSLSQWQEFRPSKVFVRGRNIALQSKYDAFRLAKSPPHRQLGLLHAQRVLVMSCFV
jgi:hypothetical protein